MIEVNIEGRHYIPGRGTVFVADRRENDFDLLTLAKGSSIVVEDKVWDVVNIECMANGNLSVGQIIGIVVKESRNN